MSNTTTTSITSSSNNSESSTTNYTRTTTPIQLKSSLQSSSRQLNRLKQFFSRLYYFGLDISSEVGERVRALILALINNVLSVEEFHGKVQMATSFPLRPFALPFLKSTLPILQRDLSQLTLQTKQSTSQYLAQHEELILLPRDTLQQSNSPSSFDFKEQLNENSKRPLSNDLYEFDGQRHTRKRSSTIQMNSQQHHRSLAATTLHNNSNSNSNHLVPLTLTRCDIRDKERVNTSNYRDHSLKESSIKNIDDSWRNAEKMLNSILEMVTKAKGLLFILKQKDNYLRHLAETNDLEWRRKHAHMLKQTEDRIVESQRKAEETILEMKRQSTVDLQNAVSRTEQKSNEILLRECEQYQRLNQELRGQTFEETYALFNQQGDGPEQCWHCGRRAIETCSGCKIARYCGQYCQHRDWDLHRKLCGPELKEKFVDNPQLYRNSLSKLDINISLPHQTETLSNVSQRNSDTTSNTSHLTVSTPTTVETAIVENMTANDDNKLDTEKEENTAMKTEDI